MIRIILTNRKEFTLAENSKVKTAREVWQRIRSGFPMLVDEAWYDVETSRIVDRSAVMTMFNPELVERVTEE